MSTTSPPARQQAGVAPDPWRAARSGQPARPEAKRFRPDIEGMRAIAVLAVVAYHAGVPGFGGGYIGVDVFFVISGFLITSRLYDELRRTGRISLSRFYSRRLIRLLPASTLVVLATLGAAWICMPGIAARAVSWDALAASGWTMNYRLALQETDYLSADRAPSPLQHFWSLAVEEQFYLLWPLLLLACAFAVTLARRGRSVGPAVVGTLVAVSAGSLVLSVWQTEANASWAYFGIHTRAWELGAGALAAVTAHRLTGLRAPVAAALTWAGLAAVAASVLLFTEATPFPGYAALLPVLGATAMIVGGLPAPRTGAGLLLNTPPMQHLGRLSYGWYLWHWPVLMLAPYVLGHEIGRLTAIALAAAALLPAWVSLVTVEDRIRFHAFFRPQAHRGLFAGGGLAAGATVIAVLTLQVPVAVAGTGTAVETQAVALDPAGLSALIATSAAAGNLPANLRPALTEAAGDQPRDGDCSVGFNEESVTTNLDRGCERRGDLAGSQTVVLLGDSHAHQWFDPLNAIALERQWRLVVLIKDGCTPADALTNRGDTGRPYQECPEWRATALDRIDQIRPAMVVMTGLTFGERPIGTKGNGDAAWAAAWETTVKRVQAAGARAVILQDTPYPRRDVPLCLAANPTAVQTCALDPAAAVSPVRQRAIAEMAARNDATVIDPTPWFCTPTVCPAVIGNTVVYRDRSHVTATYAALLSEVLGAKLAAR